MIKRRVFDILKRSFIVFLMILMVCPITAFATEEDDDTRSNDTDVSLYTVASASAAYYDAAMAHIEDDKNSFWDKLFKRSGAIVMKDGDATAGNAGGMLGYVDPDKHSFIGWAFSQLSQASQTYSYASLAPNKESKSDDKDLRGDGFQEYAYYGYALRLLGFDSTANESLDIASIGRWIGGALMIVAYTGTTFVNMMFTIALSVLDILNPFKWFADSSFVMNFVEGSKLGALQGIQNFVSGMYDIFYEAGILVIMPVLLACTVFAILVLRKPAASKLKTYLIRAGFIIVGIPLLGSMYTAAISSGIEAVNNGVLNTNYIIMSEFVDFESWASKTQLAVPSDAHIDVDTSSVIDGYVSLSNSNLSLRDLARRVNRSASIEVSDPVNSVKDDSLSWTTKAMSFARDTDTDTKTFFAVKAKGKNFAGGINIITRFMNSSFYHASDYETEWKADLVKKSSGSDAAMVDNIRDKMIDVAHQSSYSGGDFVGTDEPFATGSLIAEKNGNQIVYKTAGDKGLSPLSMYNYLNSTFSNSSVVVYSTNRASSGLIRQSHHSVNTIGTGVMGVLYFLDTLVMLYCMVIVGFGYAFSIILGSLKRGIRIIVSVPAAMLGSLKAISRIITVTAMMMINIFVTLFMYEVVQVLLVGLMGILEDPINSTFGKLGLPVTVLGNPAAGGAFGIIFLIISLIITISFTIIAMRLRKKVVRAADEAMGNVIDRVFGPSGMKPEVKGPGMISKAAGAVASGAGMALGGKLMDGAMGAAGMKTASVAGVDKGEAAGSDVGDAVKSTSAGSAQNPTGKSEVEVSDGNAIQGADKQRIDSGGDGQTKELSGGSDAEGRRMLAQNAESLSEMKTDGANGNEGAKEAEKIHASEDIQKEAHKDKAKGVAKAGVGAVEAGVGAYTGNTDLVKRGAENMAEGGKDVKAGAQKGLHADEAANKQVEQNHQEKQNQQTQKDSLAQETAVKNAVASDNVDASKNVDGSTSADMSKNTDAKQFDTKNVDSKTSDMKADSNTKAKSNTDVNSQTKVKQTATGEQQKKSAQSGQKQPAKGGTKVQSDKKSPKADNKSKTPTKSANATKSASKQTVKNPTESKSTAQRSKVATKALNSDKAKAAAKVLSSDKGKTAMAAAAVGVGVGGIVEKKTLDKSVGSSKTPDTTSAPKNNSDFIS